MTSERQTKGNSEEGGEKQNEGKKRKGKGRKCQKSNIQTELLYLRKKKLYWGGGK